MAARPAYRRAFIRLRGFLRPYKGAMIVSIVLAAGAQAAALAMIFLTKDVISAIQQGKRGELRNLVIAVVGVGLARALMMMGRRLIAGRQALAVEMDLRTQLYARLVRLSFGFYDRHQTGQLMSRATVDLQGVRFFLGYGLIFFFQHILTIPDVGVAMFIVNW